jgi:circadian clock protein KaiC
MFLFEESISNLLHRADGLNMDLRAALEAGMLTIQQIDPAELSPGQFSAAAVRAAAARRKVVVIDSLNGYLNAVPDERFLTTYLHELLTYLGQHHVVTILVGVQQGMLGGNMSTRHGRQLRGRQRAHAALLRADGEVKQAVSVFKKRGSLHERTIRAFSMSRKGIQVGEVLRGYRGILTGVPVQRSETAERPRR